MSRRTPRPYQQAHHDAVWATLGRDYRSTVGVMPTGSGKTFVAAMIAETGRKEFGFRTLFLANREILVEQAEASLSEHGLSVLVEMGGQKAHKTRLVADPDVIVATVQTLHEKRLVEHWPRDYIGLIIQDECHHANQPSHRRIYSHFSEALHHGLTATLGGGKMLGNVYEKKVYEYKIRDAIRDGCLSPIHLKRIPIVIDLRDISTIGGGDYNSGDLAERISPKIEELADGIKHFAGERYGVIFTPDVGCALAMASALTGLGHEARYVAGTGGKFGMPKKERKAILKAFNRCEFQTIVCCDLLFEGWDAPHVSFVGNCRPTKKLYRFQQMVGRGTRPCEELGKEELLVIDFDWKTSRHARDLAATFDLFSGELDERVKKRAKKKIAEKEAKGEEVDFEQEIEEATDYWKKQDKMLIRLSGRKLRLMAQPIVYDPIGVGKLIGTKLVKRYDIDPQRAGPASDRQLAKLRMLGVDSPGEISTWGATKLIRSLEKRREEGLATPSQLARMSKMGVNEEIARSMTGEQAQDWLAKNLTQQELFG